MRQRNGFLTLYVIWLGLIALTITVAASVVSRMQLRNAAQYATAIRLTYAAESMMYVAWAEVTAQDAVRFPTQKRAYTTDPYKVLAPLDTVEYYWVANVYTVPYTGTAWAIVQHGPSHVQRTSSVRFSLWPATDTEPVRYEVMKQQY